MSSTTLVRPTERTLSHLFHWLGLEAPAVFTEFGQSVPVESFTRDGAYVVRADLPGVDPDKDIQVTIEGDVLTIFGERREEEHDNGHSEVRYGSFLRRLRLPDGAEADKIEATYDNGVLQVSVPVAESAAEPVRIAIQRTDADS